MDLVPTINIDDYSKGTLSDESQHQLDQACRDHGFFLLKGHGMDTLIDEMWRQTRAFFASPMAVKRSVMRTEANPLGYYDRELTKQMRDLKEVFDFKAGGYQSSRSPIRTQWPETLPDFKPVLSSYFQACTSLAEQTISMVYSTLGLPTNQVGDDFGQNHTSSMRLNYYPINDPLTASEQARVNALGDMALHHHTDSG